jgi:hypothetical protein
MRYRIRLSEDELDRGSITASDFTIIIRNLPVGNYNEKELKSELEKWWSMQNFEEKCFITKINIAYDILEYSDLCKKKKELVTKKIKMEGYKA